MLRVCLWVYHVWVSSSLIFSNANEGVGAKITRPTSSVGPLFIDVLHLSKSLPLSCFLHPLTVARVFSLPSCYEFVVFSAVIKAQCVFSHRGRNIVWLQKVIIEKWWLKLSEINKDKNSTCVKLPNIVFQMQVSFLSNHKYTLQNKQSNTMTLCFFFLWDYCSTHQS